MLFLIQAIREQLPTTIDVRFVSKTLFPELRRQPCEVHGVRLSAPKSGEHLMHGRHLSAKSNRSYDLRAVHRIFAYFILP